MSAALALLAATFTGSADYFGGVASRTDHPLRVVVWSQGIGFVFGFLVAGVGRTRVVWTDVGWGALGGVALAIALLALYRGYTESEVGLVAPIAAVGNAAVPALWGLANGDRPSLVVGVGILLGLVAIGLVSRTGTGRMDADTRRTGILLGLAAGISFGVLFIALSYVRQEPGIWPLAASRASAMGTAAAAAVFLGEGVRGVSLSNGAIIACGVLGVLGNGSYIIAAQTGLLTVVVVLASLYPIATVSLARIIDKEPVRRERFAGIVLALFAISLIVAG